MKVTCFTGTTKCLIVFDVDDEGFVLIPVCVCTALKTLCCDSWPKKMPLTGFVVKSYYCKLSW